MFFFIHISYQSLTLCSVQFSTFQVQRQVHPSLIVEEAALEYIESLIIRLLAMLCSGQPHNVQHLEDRVQKTFPHPIDQWAINEARAALEKKSKQEGKKKMPTTVLPIDKIHPLLKVSTEQTGDV